MDDDAYVLHGMSPTAVKLLRLFLASAIADNGGTLNISAKAFSEVSESLRNHRVFEILATPGPDRSMDITLEWTK